MNRLDRALRISQSFTASGLDPNRQFAVGVEYWTIKQVLSHPQEEPCPFCGSCPCSHWDGIGWVNPIYKSQKK